MPSEPVLTYDPRAQHPLLRLPAGACDSHVHVFGPADRFPYAPERNFTPVDAPKEALFALHRQLGVDRCVIVQSAVHGFDNRVVEDAIAAGGGRYLGVALVPVDVSDAELARLAGCGFRAVRFNFMRHLAGGHDIHSVLALTPRLRAAGLHLQVHFESALVHELAEPLARSAVPVVIDHMGRVDATLGAEHPDFRALFEMLANPLFRVKISGIDRIDSKPSAAPSYDSGVELARRLLAAYPDRCLWGTDWPHPNHTHMPSDAALVDALERIAPVPDLLQRLLVTNPANFYRFEA
ncbi:amidohydrolase family protein [Ramlibacter agri]|uniref:amidohydrolase family protein n=1 Tax=Ramlibacter agri TaxID=2728837 RepID=UPI00315AB6A6